MEMQKILLSDGTISWTIANKDYLPLPHVEKWVDFIALLYEENTVENYVRHLTLFFTFCEQVQADWKEDISFSLLKTFIWWLKNPNYLKVAPKNINDEPLPRIRGNKSINTINIAVKNFYDYHTRIRTFETDPLNTVSVSHRGKRKTKYRNFLEGIDKNAPQVVNKIRLPEEAPPIIRPLKKHELDKIFECCRTIRDKLIFSLFYETGARIGELLGLRHEDIEAWDNKITFRKRRNNPNKSNQKTKAPRTLDVTPDVMNLYTSYLVEEVEDLENDFVFVVLQGPTRGSALTVSAFNSIVRTVRKKTGIKRLHPHLFRHTNITDMLKSGVSIKVAQERSGIKDVTTLLDRYAHVDDEESRVSINIYHNHIRDSKKEKD
ncbi:MAG: tyrosine-type recombinase/integrase [Pedobacter sp.]